MSDQALPQSIHCFRDALGLAMQLHHEEIESFAYLPDTSDEASFSLTELVDLQAEHQVSDVDAQHSPDSTVAVALLAATGECLDLGLFRSWSVEAAANWATGICRIFDDGTTSVENVLLISVSSTTPKNIQESDLELYRSIRSRLSIVGVGLLDWIETDGDHVRSFAYLTCPSAAWPGPNYN